MQSIIHYLKLSIIHVKVDMTARLQFPINARVRMNYIDKVTLTHVNYGNY
jgi:hypothetical protein